MMTTCSTAQGRLLAREPPFARAKRGSRSSVCLDCSEDKARRDHGGTSALMAWQIEDIEWWEG